VEWLELLRETRCLGATGHQALPKDDGFADVFSSFGKPFSPTFFQAERKERFLRWICAGGGLANPPHNGSICGVLIILSLREYAAYLTGQIIIPGGPDEL